MTAFAYLSDYVGKKSIQPKSALLAPLMHKASRHLGDEICNGIKKGKWYV
jgi:hypothetical protein